MIDTEPGALLVGSVPLPDAEAVFKKCSESLAGCLKSVPDGETGPRWFFIGYQVAIFESFPTVLAKFGDGYDPVRLPRAECDVYDENLQRWLEANTLMNVMYDSYAIASYKQFRRLKQDGHFAPQTRFQVSIPSPTNIIGGLIEPRYRMQVEPFYTSSLIKALEAIQQGIPHDDLTIQIDMALDVAIVEAVSSAWWDLNKTSVFDGVIQRASVLPRLIEPEVKLGFHFCYGDAGHQHWKQPLDLSNVVKMATALLRECGRKVDYVHFPVPIGRDDNEYFAALRELEEARTELGQDTTLYLGLVHANDPDGTRRRIAAVRRAWKRPFGLATECGLGRTPPEDLDSIFDIIRSNIDTGVVRSESDLKPASSGTV